MLRDVSTEQKAFFFFLFLHWGPRWPLVVSIRAIKYILMYCQYLFAGAHFLQTVLFSCMLPKMFHKKVSELQTANIKILLQNIWDSCIKIKKWRNSERRNENVIKQSGYSCWKSVFILRLPARWWRRRNLDLALLHQWRTSTNLPGMRENLLLHTIIIFF